MAKPLLKVNRVYQTPSGPFTCIHTHKNLAWMVHHLNYPHAAYVWDRNTGKSISLNPDYDVILP